MQMTIVDKTKPSSHFCSVGSLPLANNALHCFYIVIIIIAPLTVVNYKADPVAARAHASHSFRPAGHTFERPRNH